MSVKWQLACALFCGPILVLAQPPSPAPAPIPSPISTLRITVTLVQLDAVVTDAAGRHVMDLSQGDFQLLQDGQEQPITFFSKVPGAPPRHEPGEPGREPLPITSAPLTSPAEVRRAIAIVVDDLALTFENLVRTRNALKRYVETQMVPGDLVSIVCTGGGIAVLEQFTTDKRILLEALANLKWRFNGRQGIGTISLHQAGSKRPGEPPDDAYSLSALGALGTLEEVIVGMKNFSGRKSVVFLSDDLRADGTVNAAVDHLTDLANRSMVSLYAVDPGGLRSGPHLVQRGDVAVIARDPESSDDQTVRQEGLAALASRTGGIFYHNRNDIESCIAEAADDQLGYYLLGYSPKDGTFDKSGGGKFHRLTVRVKRPGLKVRWKSGFNGVPDQLAPTGILSTARSSEQQLLDALASPFTATGIKVRLTSSYIESPSSGPAVYSMLHFEAKDLTFQRADPSTWSASVDIVWSAYRGMKNLIWQGNKVQELRLSDNDYRKALRDGITLPLTVRAEHPGTFLLRIVVRDAISQRLGSASQYIEVPNTRDGKFGMTGIALNLAPKEFLAENGARPPLTLDTWTQGGPAIRRYLPGQAILYAYMVLNPKLNSAGQKANIVAHIRLFRGGKLIYTGADTHEAMPKLDDPAKLIAGGVLLLGERFAPGEYLIQVIVRDKNRGKKEPPLVQWTDFEVVAGGNLPQTIQ